MLLPFGMRCCLRHGFASPKIEQSKDEDPDKIDEVPIEARHLDDLVIPLPAGEEAALFLIEVTTPNLARHDDQEDHADRHMGPVKARDHEEGRTELRRTPGISPRTHTFPDEFGPFESLHADEAGAKS